MSTKTTSADRLKPTRCISDGARALVAHIRKRYGSIPAFAEAHSLDRIQLQRAINGEHWKRISVDFAHAIEVATRGAVKIPMWLSSTAIAVDAGAHASKPRKRAA